MFARSVIAPHPTTLDLVTQVPASTNRQDGRRKDWEIGRLGDWKIGLWCRTVYLLLGVLDIHYCIAMSVRWVYRCGGGAGESEMYRVVLAILKFL